MLGMRTNNVMNNPIFLKLISEHKIIIFRKIKTVAICVLAKLKTDNMNEMRNCPNVTKKEGTFDL